MLLTWLKRRPRPSHLIVKTDDGESREIDLGAVRSWANVAETVLALDAVSVEALDATKKLLRVTRIETTEADDEDLAGPGVASLPSPSRGAAPPRAPAVDAETRRFELFAFHVAAAYQTGPAIAFQKLTELYELSNARFTEQNELITHLTRQVRDLTEELADVAAAQATPGDPMTELISNFSAGAAMAANPPPMPNGAINGAKPNGKH